jgi:hypothetical protein
VRTGRKKIPKLHVVSIHIHPATRNRQKHKVCPEILKKVKLF